MIGVFFPNANVAGTVPIACYLISLAQVKEFGIYIILLDNQLWIFTFVKYEKDIVHLLRADFPQSIFFFLRSGSLFYHPLFCLSKI